MILMCKNTPVYNIDTEEVLNQNLLPGLMQRKADNYVFDLWMNLRYSSDTNSVSRKLKNTVFVGQDRENIDKITHSLSLSDCYWVKDEKEDLLFENISPYTSYFWSGYGRYTNEAVPTLYLSGYLNKEWLSSEYLFKYDKGINIETECYKVCLSCGIPCAEIQNIDGGIAVKNITNVNFMLEQADMSGRINPYDFSEEDILSLFELWGVQMLVIDAIVGNGDRHAGNFGWLRNTNTGEYVCMAPLYDFDHALDSKSEYDILIGDMLDSIKGNKMYEQECYRIAKIVSKLNTNEIFKKRAKTILRYLI